MANANKPMGLSPHSYMNGAKYTGQGTVYFIPSTDANAFAIGDPVTLVTSAADVNGIPGVTLATGADSNLVLGCIVGILGNAPYGSTNIAQFQAPVIPATKTAGWYVMVEDDPNVIFAVQEIVVSAHAALTVTSVGKGFNLVAGTNNGYISQWGLDNNSSGTTNVKQLQILRLLQQVDNAVGQYAKWLVRINQHQFNAPVAPV